MVAPGICLLRRGRDTVHALGNQSGAETPCLVSRGKARGAQTPEGAAIGLMLLHDHALAGKECRELARDAVPFATRQRITVKSADLHKRRTRGNLDRGCSRG